MYGRDIGPFPPAPARPMMSWMPITTEMSHERKPAERPRPDRRPFVAALVAGLLALAGTIALYSWLNPKLEARTDWLRETQGLLFSMIPIGTATAALIVWLAAKAVLDRRSRPSGQARP